MVAFLTQQGPCPWSLQPQPQRRQTFACLLPTPLPPPAASAAVKLRTENEGYHKGARGWSEK